jgi:hypothetical protein
MQDPIVIILTKTTNRRQVYELESSYVEILIMETNPSIFKFPESVICIVMNCNCSLVDTTLPKNLKKIIFYEDYNQSLENVNLPDSIEIIEFNNYSGSLFSVKLPKNLKEIINNSYDEIQKKNKQGLLPRDKLINPVPLHKLINPVMNGSSYSLPFFLPPNIKKIILSSDYSYDRNSFVLPKKLKKLAIGGIASNEIIFTQMRNELNELKSLEILDKLEFSIKNIPNSIKKLKLPKTYNARKTLITLPKGLEHLTISGNLVNKSIINNLPSTIKSLEITTEIDFESGVELPPGLEKLHLNFRQTWDYQLVARLSI